MPIDVINNFWSFLGITESVAREMLSGLCVVGICILAIAFSRRVIRRLF